MSIRKKIILSFIISASLIASLVVFEYYNYIVMRNEIRFLELTDTIRSKSLQLRRHEKNFFLFSPQMADEESVSIRDYIEQLRAIIDENLQRDPTGRLLNLDAQLEEYSARFEKIKAGITELNGLMDSTVPADSDTRKYYPLIELTFVERPSDSAVFLEGAFGLEPDNPLVSGLRTLDSDIGHLRKSGETILSISKELDKSARDNVDRTIGVSQTAILVFFPLFLIVGTGTLLLIAGDVTLRLKSLTETVESVGRNGLDVPPVSPLFPGKRDELGVLAEKFREMRVQLNERKREISRKNEELLETKKLAAIGTLAAGVAHELNNPLNNIYVSAQVMKRKSGDLSPMMKEVVEDIAGQTARVKRIVGDLLEFARMKEPETTEVDICGMINRAFGMVMAASKYPPDGIIYSLNCDRPELRVEVEPDRMDRVLINLISNAVDAMNGQGELTVTAAESGDAVEIAVTDTGAGIEPDALGKIFEPFYTTKDRGTGLGLSIAYNVIRKHGGELTAASEIGKGTTFNIRLPRKRPRNAV